MNLTATAAPVQPVAPTRAPSLTLVCCVESGTLEAMTLRMAESLRRFGGRFAKTPIVAVTPRFGPPLASLTKSRMRELGIEHLHIRPRHDYGWHHFMNKVCAIKAVEDRATTQAVAWVDSDIIFLNEPGELELGQESFAASMPDDGIIGTKGPGDPNDPFWARCTALLGRDIDELPWVTTGFGNRIRFYWNAGLFSYDRACGLGQAFVDNVVRALDAKVASNHTQVHLVEQVMLAVTVFHLGLSYRVFPDTSNFPLVSHLPQHFDPAKLREVAILHYHDSMGPAWWPRLLECLGPGHPAVHDWLRPLGPIQDPAPTAYRAFRELLRIGRGLQRRGYYARSGFTKGHTRAN